MIYFSPHHLLIPKMIHWLVVILLFSNLQTRLGHQHNQENLHGSTPENAMGKGKDVMRSKNEHTSGTTPLLTNLDDDDSESILKQHRDYFLPQSYSNHDEDDEEDGVYPEYDYDGNTSNYEDHPVSGTTNPASKVHKNYLQFDEDTPVQANKDNLPFFLLEPENSFVLKNKPATIRCRAAMALEVYFKCNGIKSPALNFEFVDPHTGVRIVEGEYNVTREQVEEYFGKDKFRCSCFAWTGRGQIRSQSAYVELAYIKKQFTTSPQAQMVEQQATSILRCEPPPAAPPPRVYWLKNGAPISDDNNVRTNEEGDLVVSQTTLQDMANYSCVAENLAGKRITEPAFLSVYVNGGWTSWTAWTDCTCQGRATVGRRRLRSCTNPRPLNGGQPCSGSSIQNTPDCSSCDIDLYLDVDDQPDAKKLNAGQWSEWSGWSRCDADCLQTRRRRCISSGPCLGKDYQAVQCSTCFESATSSYWPLVLGLSVAIVIFFVIVALVIKYITFKMNEDSPYVKSRTDLSSNFFGSTKVQSLPKQPDLSLHGDMDNLCGFTDKAKNMIYVKVNKKPNEHLYEVPQLNNSYMAPVDYTSRQCTSKIESNYAPSPFSESERSDSSCFVSSPESSYGKDFENSPSLKINMSTDSDTSRKHSEVAVSKFISSNGGWLQLERCGVALYFPDGSIDVNCKDVFSLKVLKEDWERPLLPEGMTQLSPVIKCGPQTIRLKKPAILELPHCAMLKNSNWIISLLEQKQDHNSTQWTKVLTLGEDSKDQMFLQVDSERVYLMTEHLRDFVLIGKSFSGFDIKLLKIAIFASDPYVVKATNYNLRVYVFEDTLCALYYCLENERKLGGLLIDNPKTMYCQDGCSDLCFSMEEVGFGWKTGTTYQEIPFSHVWNANLNSLHCSFSLEQTDSINCLEFKIVVFQKKCPANRQIFYVRPQDTISNANCTLSKRFSRSSLNRNVVFNILENPIDNFSFDNANINHYFTKNQISFSDKTIVDNATNISKSDKKIICNLLDVPSPMGNDWRLLAEKLSIDNCFQYLSSRISPTDIILNLFQCRNRSATALVELASTFREMERNDCAIIIERYLGPNWL